MHKHKKLISVAVISFLALIVIVFVFYPRETREQKKQRVHDELGLVDEISVEIGTATFDMNQFFGGRKPKAEFDYSFDQEVSKEMLETLGEHTITLVCDKIEYRLLLRVVDTQAPVFTAFSDFVITQGDAILYRSYVTATDNSGKEPEITVDNSQVGEDPGEYTVIYTATDEAGNAAMTSVKMTVKAKSKYTEETVGPLCDEIIASVCDAEMTDYKKAHVLYKWVRHNMTYTSHGETDPDNIWEGAKVGLSERQGDCIVFYSTYCALLTRCGIDNMMCRSNGSTEHYWTLVNVGDGWYHTDPSPHHMKYLYDSFMQTDAQLEAYTKWRSENKKDYYTFDKNAYPARETKIIYGD